MLQVLQQLAFLPHYTTGTMSSWPLSFSRQMMSSPQNDICHSGDRASTFQAHHIQDRKCYFHSINFWGLRSPKTYVLITSYYVLSHRPSHTFCLAVCSSLQSSPGPHYGVTRRDQWSPALQVSKGEEDSLISLTTMKNMSRDFCLSISAFGCFEATVLVDPGTDCQSQGQQSLMTINNLPRS